MRPRNRIDARPVEAGHLGQGELQPLGVLVAAVGAGRGHDRPEEEDQPGRGHHQRAEPPQVAVGRPAGRPADRRAGRRRAGRPGRGGRRRRPGAPSTAGSGPSRSRGFSSNSTVSPPRTIWPITPATSPSDSQVRSRRRGWRRSDPSTARITATDTSPVTVRFTNSTMAWYSNGATTRSSAQVGQSGQPRPEPVSRTAAPVHDDEGQGHQRHQGHPPVGGRRQGGQAHRRPILREVCPHSRCGTRPCMTSNQPAVPAEEERGEGRRGPRARRPGRGAHARGPVRGRASRSPTPTRRRRTDGTHTGTLGEREGPAGAGRRRRLRIAVGRRRSWPACWSPTAPSRS